MSKNSGNSALALLLGAGIGVGLGILFAPEKGSKTREKLKGTYDGLKDEAKSKWDTVAKRSKEKFSEGKQGFKESVDGILSSSSYKAEDAIVYLEEKLEQLKKQNAKFQK
ncbi:MAG: YtxH domain-containing protein [Flavobacterium sp.]|nr:YtxH domain-containing protein [Flavobacterium sp.]